MLCIRNVNIMDSVYLHRCLFTYSFDVYTYFYNIFQQIWENANTPFVLLLLFGGGMNVFLALIEIKMHQGHIHILIHISYNLYVAVFICDWYGSDAKSIDNTIALYPLHIRVSKYNKNEEEVILWLSCVCSRIYSKSK